jgi:hypothetical protein
LTNSISSAILLMFNLLNQMIKIAETNQPKDIDTQPGFDTQPLVYGEPVKPSAEVLAYSKALAAAEADEATEPTPAQIEDNLPGAPLAARDPKAIGSVATQPMEISPDAVTLNTNEQLYAAQHAVIAAHGSNHELLTRPLGGFIDVWANLGAKGATEPTSKVAEFKDQDAATIVSALHEAASRNETHHDKIASLLLKNAVVVEEVKPAPAPARQPAKKAPLITPRIRIA